MQQPSQHDTKPTQQKNERRLNRRGFLKLTGVAGGAAFLAACAAPSTPTEEGSTDAAPSGEGVTISWWNSYETDTVKTAVPQMMEAFNEVHPDITVEYELSGGPPGGGEFTEVLLTRIAAGNPPDTATTFDPPAQFAARGALEQLDSFMENAEYATQDAFFEGPLNSCRWQGGVYGLPASAGAGCIFYNVEHFEEAGLPTSREEFPTTWQDIKDTSAQLTDWADGDPTRVGFVPWGTPWLKPVWSGLNGGNLFDADSMQYNIDSAENVEWVNFWLTWLEEQFQGDLEQLNIYNTYESAYAPGAFNEGFSSMVQAGSWACSDAEMPFAWEVAKFPVGPSGSQSVTGYWPNWWIVPEGAPNLEAAFLFSEFFCTRGWEIWYQYIMDTPAWRSFPEGVLTQKLIDEVGQERATELHNFFAEYLESTVNMWNSPVENFANDTLEAAISEVLFKQSSAEEALGAAQGLIQARLEETVAAA